MRMYVRYPRRNWMPVGNMNWQTGKVILDSRIQEAAKQHKYGIIQLLRQEAKTLETTRKERKECTRQHKKGGLINKISQKYPMNLWLAWLPASIQEKLLDMPIREVRKWFSDPNYRETCISNWQKEQAKQKTEEKPDK